MTDVSGYLLVPALCALTVVMGMDNVLSVAVISAQLETPDAQRGAAWRARLYGLGLALVSRLVVLMLLVWAMRGPHALRAAGFIPVVSGDWNFRNIVKLTGGCFLLGKSLRQIVARALSSASISGAPGQVLSLRRATLQILFADQAQSIDSLVSVVGMAPSVSIMVTATIVELATILLFSTPAARLIRRYPSVQTVSVSALLLVGAVLISEGLGMPIPRSYVYSMTGFALLVEFLNLRMGHRPVDWSGAADGRHIAAAERRWPEAPRTLPARDPGSPGLPPTGTALRRT
ncbi:MAG TPA: hypothetical protein VGM03_09375 [Phycisphaerae bacterium]